MDVLLKKYFWCVNLVVIAVCAALAGRAGAHLIEQGWLLGDAGGEQPGKPRQFVPDHAERVHGKDTNEILGRNIFCSACAPEPDKVSDVKPGSAGGDPVKTGLPFDLVSTMWVPGDGKWSMAVLRDSAGKEKDSFMLNAGKKIPGTEVEIKRVDPRRVYVLNNGAIEYFEMEGTEKKKDEAQPQLASNMPPTGGATGLDNDVQKGVRCNGPSCEVDRPLLDKLLANTTELATAARFVPSMKDGRANGFKLYAIRPSSIFGKIGLQNGDTIKSINGMEMSSPDQALGVYSKLRSASHLSVSVERRGETVTLDYTIR